MPASRARWRRRKVMLRRPSSSACCSGTRTKNAQSGSHRSPLGELDEDKVREREGCRRIVPRLEDLVAARMIKQFEDASLEIPACLLPGSSAAPRQGPRRGSEGYDSKTAAAASWQCRFVGGISNRQEEQLELLPQKFAVVRGEFQAFRVSHEGDAFVGADAAPSAASAAQPPPLPPPPLPPPPRGRGRDGNGAAAAGGAVALAAGGGRKCVRSSAEAAGAVDRPWTCGCHARATRCAARAARRRARRARAARRRGARLLTRRAAPGTAAYAHFDRGRQAGVSGRRGAREGPARPCAPPDHGAPAAAWQRGLASGE